MEQANIEEPGLQVMEVSPVVGEALSISARRESTVPTIIEMSARKMRDWG